MKIKSIKQIDPVESNCISVDSHNKLFAIGEEGNLLTHNSVAQQNIIISCLLRPENWVILGIDLKKVVLTRFRKFGVKVATEVETAVEFLRFAQAVMMKRYARMEKSEVNDFEDLDGNLQALMVMIDEAGELLSPSGVKALSENTLVPLSDGTKKLLRDVAEGDEILNNKGEPTTVIDKLNLDNNEEITEEKEVIKDTFNSLVDLTSAQVELVDEILELAQMLGYISYGEYKDGVVTESDMEMRTSEDIWEVRRKLKGANGR